MSRDSSRLTVIVPTRNRSSYLHRLLSYYASCDFKCPLLIGDSGDEEECQQTARSVQFFGRALEVSHQIFPSHYGIYETARRLVEATSTPYVALLADDDLLVPRGLEHAVDFLEAHPDYSVAHGNGIVVKLLCQGPYGPVDWLAPYPRYSIEHSHASQRLAEHMGCHQSLAFSVHRRQACLTGFRKTDELGLDLEFAELFTGSLNVIWGKTKNLDCLYLMRQAHGQRTSVRGREAFGWITSPTAALQYEHFRDSLTKELMENEKISLEHAQESVKKAFWDYLQCTLEIKWQWHYGLKKPHIQPPWRRFLTTLPGVPWTRQKVRTMIPRKSNEISLPSLLRASCQYHDDFMPIYRAMTQPMFSLDGTLNQQEIFFSTPSPAWSRS